MAPSEFHTQVVRQGVLPCIRIRYKHSALKQYFKEGKALRTEMVFNNPYDVGLKRSLSNFDALFVRGRELCQRLLTLQTISQDVFLPWQEVQTLQRSTLSEDGQRASALPFGQPRTMALCAALLYHAQRPDSFRNQPFRATVAQLLGLSAHEYSGAQASYDLRRLRLKGLIVRNPHSHSYHLTDQGCRITAFWTKLYERLYRPGLVSTLTPLPFSTDLSQALDSVASVIRSWSERAFAHAFDSPI